MYTTPESVLPGHPLNPGSKELVPKCQMAIVSYDPVANTETVVGSAIRIDNYAVLPRHAVCVGVIRLRGRDPSKHVEMKSEDFQPLCTDVVIARLPESTWSLLGISIATLGNLGRSAQTTIVSNVDYCYSIGQLVPLENRAGRVCYKSSTAPGFSGSAYVSSGTLVVGIHLHGRGTASGFNGGYEALYLWCLLKHHMACENIPIPEAFDPQDQRKRPTVGSDAYLAEMEDADFDFEDVGPVNATGAHMAVGRSRTTGKWVYAPYSSFEERAERKAGLQKARDQGTLKAWHEITELEEMEDESLLGRPECLLTESGASFPGEGHGSLAGAPGGQGKQNAPLGSTTMPQPPQSTSTKRSKLIQKFDGLSTNQLIKALRLLRAGEMPETSTSRQTPARPQNGPALNTN